MGTVVTNIEADSRASELTGRNSFQNERINTMSGSTAITDPTQFVERRKGEAKCFV
jgi:hypothetical protein